MKKLEFKKYNKVSGIYKITDIINGKIYIGSSKNLYDRIRIHIMRLNHNNHSNILLQRFVNKYGINSLKLDIIELCDSKDCIILEQKWIDCLKCVSPNGFNLCEKAYSVIGRRHTQEAKNKISKANKGKIAAFKGMKHSNETKNNISNTKLRKSLGEFQECLFVLITKEEEKVFNSLTEASTKSGTSKTAIINNINGLSKKTKQGIWKRKLIL